MMLKALGFTISLFLFPVLARGQVDSPPRPDFSSWTLTSTIPISINADKGIVVYLGYEREYQNSENPSEFLRVYARFIPFASLPVRSTVKKTNIQTALNYLDYRAKELFDKRSNSADIFLHLHWRSKHDSQTGEDIIDGEIESWFLNQNGFWKHNWGAKLFVTGTSQPNKNRENSYLIVSRLYEIEGESHALMIDQDYINLLERR